MYCINPESNEPIFLLFDQVGKDSSEPLEPYVDGNLFAAELLYMDGEGKDRIQIFINSEGGSVKQGYSIASAMLKTKTKIDTCVVGIAYSIAGVIALMGRKVEALDFASIMLHNPYNPDGTQDDGLEVIRKSLVTAISSRRGMDFNEVEGIMARETYYSADDAKAAGLIDDVVSCGEINRPRATADLKAKKAAGVEWVNKFKLNNNTKTNNSTMRIESKKEIADMLNLSEEASDASFIRATKKLVAKNEEDEALIKNLTEALQKAEADKCDAENALAAATVKMEEDKKAEEEAKAKMEDDEAKAMAKSKIVAALEGQGHEAKDETVANYMNIVDAKNETSVSSVLNIIAQLPLQTRVIKAPKMEEAKNKSAVQLPSGLEAAKSVKDFEAAYEAAKNYSRKMGVMKASEVSAKRKI